MPHTYVRITVINGVAASVVHTHQQLYNYLICLSAVTVFNMAYLCVLNE